MPPGLCEFLTAGTVLGGGKENKTINPEFHIQQKYSVRMKVKKRHFNVKAKETNSLPADLAEKS
jgi:hypothetical protein